MFIDLSPAAIVPKILNNLFFFLFKFLVSFEFITYPSKAALFAAGLFTFEKIFSAETLLMQLSVFKISLSILIFDFLSMFLDFL